jgi:hypothetical protein
MRNVDLLTEIRSKVGPVRKSNIEETSKEVEGELHAWNYMFYCLILNGNETHFVKETATRVSQI